MQSKTWHKHQNPKPRSIPRAKIPPPSVHTSPGEDMWVTKLRQIEKGSKLARERGLTSRHFYKTLRGGLASRYCPPLFLAVPSYSTISTTQAPIPHGLSPPTHTHAVSGHLQLRKILRRSTAAAEHTLSQQLQLAMRSRWIVNGSSDARPSINQLGHRYHTRSHPHPRSEHRKLIEIEKGIN